MKILMVCLGNICRSPLAEGVLRSKAEQLGLEWEVDSAGTSHYETGCAPHHLSQKVAQLNGIQIDTHCCRAFEQKDMTYFDRIYVMDRNNYNEVRRISKDLWDETKTDMLMNELYPGKNTNIPDPWYGEESDYFKVYDMIDKACDKIIEKYGTTAGQH